MALSIKKIYTDNPFVDSLLYYVKILAYGTVLKMQAEADNAETTDSLKNFDTYSLSYEGRGYFDLYTYTEAILSQSSVPTANISKWAANNALITDQYKAELTVIAQKIYIENYIELNAYYRKITGMPKIGEFGIPIKNYEYLIPDGNDTGTATYVHELGAAGCKMLDFYGILDIIKADYPDATYLDYVTCGIELYKARKSFGFQILYSPSCGVIEIDEKFTSKYELNRIVMTQTIYSDAMAIRSDYYDAFMASITMLMTMTDMLSEVQEHIIKKEILDARCIEYIFSIYGIPYYHSIPLKFQTKMVKQVNSMVSNKSCMQGMTNLISMFGCEDIDIFKYYLLRDRKKDNWGNFIYNSVVNLSSKENDCVLYKSVTTTIADDTIPFPFEYYLQKGNIMFVRIDNKRLRSDYYSVYNSNKIEFLNTAIAGKSTITYEFYYDKTTEFTPFTPDVDDAVMMLSETIIPTNNNVSIALPYANYFIDGNEVIVSIGGTFIHPDAYYYDGTNLIIDDSYSISGREVVVIFLYGSKTISNFRKTDVLSYVDDQTKFTIPEPFKNYVSNGNCFFVTVGSIYVDPRRYAIANGQIEFNDMTISKGRAVTFNFIYSTASVYNAIDVIHKIDVITATEYCQTEFPITYPIDNYIKLGFKVYIKLRGWFISEEYFDIYTGKLAFKDTSMMIHKGETFELHFEYINSDANIAVSKDTINPDTAYQDTFVLNTPTDNYFDRGNKVIIDMDGYLLQEGTDYTFSSDHTSMTIINKDLLPQLNQKLSFIYIYNTISKYAIKIYQETLSVDTDGQKAFTIKLPFYPYFETNQNMLVIYNGLLINPSAISITDKYTLNIDSDGLKAGHDLVILFVYNTRYVMDADVGLLTVEEKEITVINTITDDLIIPVPIPFDDYIENDWPFFVDALNMKIEASLYECVNGGLMFLDPKNISSYSKMEFVFVYKASYVTEESDEDYISDIDLKFAKVNLDSAHPIEDVMQLNTKSYNSITLHDKFWDGEDNQDNAHEAIMEEILKRKFNYARTKYMTIEYVVNLTDMSFEISYFYNMLYDDVFREDLLKVNVSSISANKSFKLADLFVYMTALAYDYSGVQDTIMNSPTKILFVKGFNFRANLNSLKQYIRDNRRMYQDYDVFGFLIPDSEIPTIEEFINIYTTNKNIYKTITKGMTEAPNYDIYKIWKTLYDSLMIWNFNLEFYRMSNGKIATTLTEFLQDEDNVLYQSLISIKGISDQETRENQIVTVISDIVYILEQYISSADFKYIYKQFPGVSSEYLLQYLFTIINFFKSYKVILKEMNVNFVIDDPNENTIRFYDKQAMTVNLKKPSYLGFREQKASTASLQKSETIGFKEKLDFSYYKR